MFGKKEKVLIHIPNGDDVFVKKSVAKYIAKLEKERDDARWDASRARNELRDIKPVLEVKELKPAVSECCEDCKFVVTSQWDGSVLGCRKDSLCDDFIPKNKE